MRVFDGDSITIMRVFEIDLITFLIHIGFKSYFSERWQFVCYNNVSSSLLPMRYGVPQGSILGPLLFIIYMNDIVGCSDILNFILYADDTNLFLDTDNLLQGLDIVHSELLKLDKWVKSNALTFNKTKLHHVIFNRKGSRLQQIQCPLYIDSILFCKALF